MTYRRFVEMLLLDLLPDQMDDQVELQDELTGHKFVLVAPWLDVDDDGLPYLVFGREQNKNAE